MRRSIACTLLCLCIFADRAPAADSSAAYQRAADDATAYCTSAERERAEAVARLRAVIDAHPEGERNLGLDFRIALLYLSQYRPEIGERMDKEAFIAQVARMQERYGDQANDCRMFYLRHTRAQGAFSRSWEQQRDTMLAFLRGGYRDVHYGEDAPFSPAFLTQGALSSLIGATLSLRKARDDAAYLATLDELIAEMRADAELHPWIADVQRIKLERMAELHPELADEIADELATLPQREVPAEDGPAAPDATESDDYIDELPQPYGSKPSEMLVIAGITIALLLFMLVLFRRASGGGGGRCDQRGRYER